MTDKLTESDLVYAAISRCSCGNGLAYRKGCGPDECYWECSDILLGKAKSITDPDHVQHTGKLPFAFWEVLAEGDYAAYGATTRPKQEGKQS